MTAAEVVTVTEIQSDVSQTQTDVADLVTIYGSTVSAATSAAAAAASEVATGTAQLAVEAAQSAAELAKNQAENHAVSAATSETTSTNAASSASASATLAASHADDSAFNAAALLPSRYSNNTEISFTGQRDPQPDVASIRPANFNDPNFGWVFETTIGHPTIAFSSRFGHLRTQPVVDGQIYRLKTEVEIVSITGEVAFRNRIKTFRDTTTSAGAIQESAEQTEITMPGIYQLEGTYGSAGTGADSEWSSRCDLHI